MTRAVTAAEMREVDRLAIERFGVPALALMENAGRAVADRAAALTPAGGLIAVVAGRGNNGGDGLVAARHLHGRGYTVEVWLAAGAPAGDAAVHAEVWRRLHRPLADALADLAARLRESDLVVDAVLGTGASGEVRDGVRAAIEAMNACGRPILAVDCPSGLDCTSGAALGACVRATETVALALPKRGFSRGVGPAHVGRVTVADIGIPPEAVDDVLGPGG